MKSVLFLTVLFATHSFAQLDLPKDLDVGIYVAHQAEWKELPVEIVNWKTGGVVKSVFTRGIIRGDLNGRILGGESSVALSGTSRLEIIVRTLEGTSAEEYQLLKLRDHHDAREFRSVTGGVWHASGGATRDRRPFTVKKVGPRLWSVALLELPNGEYGFLPPVNASSLSASGKIYSFQVSAERIGGKSSVVSGLPKRSFAASLFWPAGDYGK